MFDRIERTTMSRPHIAVCSQNQAYSTLIFGDSLMALEKPKSQDADKRSFNLLNQCDSNASMPSQTMWEFLRGVAHNFCMN